MTDYWTTEEMADDLDADVERVENAFEDLEEEGIVRRIGEDQWALLNRRKAFLFLAKNYPKVKASNLKERAKSFIQ